jgi:cytochrome c-type biogenesis protein CcmH/NrfG
VEAERALSRAVELDPKNREAALILQKARARMSSTK